MPEMELLNDNKLALYYISEKNKTWFNNIFSAYDVIEIKGFENIFQIIQDIVENFNNGYLYVFWLDNMLVTKKDIINLTRQLLKKKIENYFLSVMMNILN